MRHFCIRFLLLALLVALMPLRSMAQDEELVEFVRQELNGYYKDLTKFDQQVVTAEDAEQYESRIKNHIKLVESCYNDYSELFRYEKKLYAIYDNYIALHTQLCKRMEDLKAEKAKQEQIDKLNTKLNRYLELLTELQVAGNRCVENKRIDSLSIIKKQAEECYVGEATIEYGANRDFIDEDENLSATWKKIKDTYTQISALEVVKSPISMTRPPITAMARYVSPALNDSFLSS